MATKPSGGKKVRLTRRNLKVFFAVTVTSVYQVILSGVKGSPVLKKIILRGESIVKAGGRMADGTMVSVGQQLIMFVPEGHAFLSVQTSYEREIARVNIHWRGGCTSSVVALFLEKDDAIACNNAENLVPRDPRWKDKTIEVLRAIGDEHPSCSVTNCPEMRLMPKEEWQVAGNPQQEVGKMIKCPGCSVELPEDDLNAQVVHMEQFHQDIIQKRLQE